MAIKKNLRSDSTYLLSNDSADNPILGARKLSDGRERLFLDYYYGYAKATSENGKEYAKAIRKRKTLDLYLWTAPRNPQERQHNKDVIELAKKIKYEESQKLIADTQGYRISNNEDMNFLDWMKNYVEAHNTPDKRCVRRAYTCFKTFLSVTPKYKHFANKIKPSQLTTEIVKDFVKYLLNKYVGDGPHTCYCRFKKIIHVALDADIFRKDPCKGVKISIDNQQLKKEILSVDEVEKLIGTEIDRQSTVIRRAFIFCLYNGLRFCDVKDLTFANVDAANRLLRFEQNKTKGHSASSSVVLRLTDYSLDLIGTPQGNDPKKELIFPLPSHTMCLKSLRRWTEKAGITKHITWHCARHTFATMVLNQGANVKTVASLLGHSSLQHTEKYLRAVDSLKAEALESLPVFKTAKDNTNPKEIADGEERHENK